MSTTPAAPPRAPRGERARRLPAVPPPWLLAAGLSLVYLAISPSSPDLAAASYRSWLFEHHGFTLWDNSWYGGHHLPAYSLLAPALGSLLGPRLLAALSMTLASALFSRLIAGAFAPRATLLAGYWFAFGAAVSLLSSRVPFDLGLAIGLGALTAARAGAPRRALSPPNALAALLSLLCSAASPVAGAFLALALLAVVLTGPRRARAAALCATSLLPIAALVIAFPEGGSQPYVGSAFYPSFLGVLAVLALIPPERTTLRAGVLLYVLAMAGSFLITSAVGGNVDRLGSLTAGPLLACLLGEGAAARSHTPAAALARRVTATAERRRALRPTTTTLLAALCAALLYWQVNAPAADYAAVASNPSVAESYYAPLLAELRALGVGYGARPARIEVVPTTGHWEARWVAPHVMLARGWERQLDQLRNPLFYRSSGPSASGYRAWLKREGISYVALPDAPLDYSGRAEARLLRTHPSYLTVVWRSRHWTLFGFRGPAVLAQPPAVLESAGEQSLSVLIPRPGRYLLRVHFTPYWALARGAGCVSQAPGEWTELSAHRAGLFDVVIRFSLARVLDHGARCS